MTTRSTALVVGAGFGGIAMAIELQRHGIDDVVVLEKAADLGGVWRENSYPGAGCDVPSPLYSFSFTAATRWPRRYARQPDILAYLRRVAHQYGVTGRIRFGREVASAEFDETTARWLVRTTGGEEYETRAFIPAVGQLSQPAYPDIPGSETFRGAAFHSAEWDHDCDLTGKRVAVIGTGASAIQFVPQIQPQVGHLAVFQRSAQYILPKRDHAYDRWYHAPLRTVPALQQLDRLGFWLYAEFAQACLSRWQALTPLFGMQAAKHLRTQVADPRLREQLTPDYTIGCKRILFSNDYLPALTKPAVDLVTDDVTEITPDGVRTADGTFHDVDVIIYGTGFAAQDLLAPMTIRGLGGHRLAETWRDGARAHLGITVPGFPNMFLVYGPNTNLGGSSIVYMLESQARYIRDAVSTLRARPDRYLDVRPEAERAWDETVQRRLARSVWTRCQSWYRAASGRVVSNWPGRTREYRRRTRRVNLADFRLGSASRHPSRTVPAD